MNELSAEVNEIRDHLSQCPPFTLLSDELLSEAASSCRVSYHRAGSVLAEPGDDNRDLHLIVRGAVELRNDSGTLQARLGEGQIVGVVSALSGRPARHRCVVLEDTVLHRLDADVVTDLRRRAGVEFDHHLISLVADRTPTPTQEMGSIGGILADPCRSLITRPPVVVTTDQMVDRVAVVMTEARVSSVIVAEADGSVVGIVTDRDLRGRVVAAGLDPGRTPVGSIMTADPILVEDTRLGHEVLLVMAEHNIHHVPVLDADGTPIGLITANDLSTARSNDPVALVGRIAKASTADAVAEAAAPMTAMVTALMVADATAETTGRLVSSITDAVTRRLCQLAEAELGPPPVPYAFVCFGSQARDEQTAFTDQDNGMILADAAGEADRDGYFAALARFVCDGLDRAGYRYCDGDIMATTDRWRAPLGRWLGYVDAWVAEPDPEAVLNAAVFFDVRHLHGDRELTAAYHQRAVERARSSDLFLGHLAAGGAEFRPPLGFFRRFVLEKDGAQKDRLDLKRTGVTPMIHLARAYALRAGSGRLNSYDRLRAVGDTPHMAAADAAELVVALEYVAYVRLQHQRRQLEAGLAPDNFIDPDSLTRLEREQLRRVFVTIDDHQNAMRRNFNTAQMG